MRKRLNKYNSPLSFADFSEDLERIFGSGCIVYPQRCHMMRDTGRGMRDAVAKRIWPALGNENELAASGRGCASPSTRYGGASALYAKK